MGRVIIGVDPHKLSATIEVLDQRENVLGGGRFGTDRDGYRQMLTVGRRWPERVWAVEGSYGIGRHLAQRLVADGEPVLDVPAKLSARARGHPHTDNGLTNIGASDPAGDVAMLNGWKRRNSAGRGATGL